MAANLLPLMAMAAIPALTGEKNSTSFRGFSLSNLDVEELVALISVLMKARPAFSLLKDAISDGEPEVEYFKIKEVFSKIGKAVKGVLPSIAPIAAGLIPGIGPVAAPIVAGIMQGREAEKEAERAARLFGSQGGLVAQTFPVPTAPSQLTPDQKSYIEGIRQMHGVHVAMAELFRIRPDVAESVGNLIAWLNVRSQPVVSVPLYNSQLPVARDRDVECDFCAPSSPGYLERDSHGGDWTGRIPSGTFFRSRLVDASVKPSLGRGVHGEVHLKTMPFALHIAGDQVPARAGISLAHELAHVAARLYKLPLRHDQVHQLGVFFATEGVPALLSLERHVGQPLWA